MTHGTAHRAAHVLAALCIVAGATSRSADLFEDPELFGDRATGLRDPSSESIVESAGAPIDAERLAALACTPRERSGQDVLQVCFSTSAEEFVVLERIF